MTALEQWSTHRLRTLAALLITASGTGHVATLWAWPLNADTVLTAACGGIYLLLGLGLFGLSRTSLILGMALPLARSLLVLWFLGATQLHWPGYLFLTADLLVISLCAVILQRVRHLPSL